MTGTGEQRAGDRPADLTGERRTSPSSSGASAPANRCTSRTWPIDNSAVGFDLLAHEQARSDAATARFAGVGARQRPRPLAGHGPATCRRRAPDARRADRRRASWRWIRASSAARAICSSVASSLRRAATRSRPARAPPAARPPPDKPSRRSATTKTLGACPSDATTLAVLEPHADRGAGDQLQLRRRHRPALAQVERDLLRQATLEIRAAAEDSTLHRIGDARLLHALEVQPHAAAADVSGQLLEPVQAPQIVILDDEEDLHRAHRARLLQDAQELLHARPVVERGTEIVDDQQRTARRRRRHDVLVEAIAVDDAAGDATRLHERHQRRPHQRRLADARLAEQQRSRRAPRRADRRGRWSRARGQRRARGRSRRTWHLSGLKGPKSRERGTSRLAGTGRRLVEQFTMATGASSWTTTRRRFKTSRTGA